MNFHKTRNDLDKDVRGTLVGLLNQRLADASDLRSQAKQAHWNVKGMSFIALHELFDRVSTEVDGHVDDIAERITTLGGTAMGTVRLAAEHSSLNEYPHEIADGVDHVDALSRSLADLGRKIRSDIDTTSELGDQDTADLFTGVSRSIDKLLWLVEAHLQS